MVFSDIIKFIRKELKIMQEELAHELNVSFSTVNRWENGHRVPKRLAIMCLIEYCRKITVSIKVISRLIKLY